MSEGSVRKSQPELVVTVAHRADCTFGSGFYRVKLGSTGGERYCKNEKEVREVCAMLPHEVVHVERDGYCLDGDRSGDANTPDVVDGEQWLSWPMERAMREVGLTSEADYIRVYRDIEAAVYRRDNREKQSGVHASIVIKRRGRPLIDVLADK